MLETVFVAAGLLVGYTYVGYPLLLRTLVRMRARAQRRSRSRACAVRCLSPTRLEMWSDHLT